MTEYNIEYHNTKNHPTLQTTTDRILQNEHSIEQYIKQNTTLEYYTKTQCSTGQDKNRILQRI